jgi:hypothetical protein
MFPKASPNDTRSTTMTITLSDITAATAAYIDTEVEVRISKVTSNLQPDHDGSYTAKVTNAAAPTGVRLTDVMLHLWVEPGQEPNENPVVLLYPPGSALLSPKATNDPDASDLDSQTPVNEFYLFFAAGPGDDIEDFDSVLDVGEVLEVELEYRAERRGDATINCHVHANVDVDRLFPRSSGTTAAKAVTVIA